MIVDPGELVELISFQKRAAAADDYGNPDTGGFVEQFRRSAKFLMRPGSEVLLAARLAGTQPVTIIVRFDSATRLIGPDWQAVEVATGIVYAIHAAADMDRSKQWISIVAEAGVRGK